MASSHKPVTAEGHIVGTFQYMAPEQLEGKEADERSDIFSLGAVLYEMASGRRAFPGKTQASIIAGILAADPPPVSSIQPLTPPALTQLIKTCLAKDPDERWQTAHDIRIQLKHISEGSSQAGVPAPVKAKRQRREMLAWALAVMAIVVACLAGAAYWREQSEKIAVKALIPKLQDLSRQAHAAATADLQHDAAAQELLRDAFTRLIEHVDELTHGLTDELSNVLPRAVADGAARPGEEAAALAAVVTVPMRLASGGGWAAVKTAAFGGRVIAVRTRLTPEQLEALWEPIQPAIARVNGVALSRKPAHPHAAVLFYDFMLGEGQEILVQGNYVPTNRKTDPGAARARLKFVDPAVMLDESAKWEKLYAEIITRQSK